MILKEMIRNIQIKQPLLINYNKLINQIKKLKEENKASNKRNRKFSEKILHIVKE